MPETVAQVPAPDNITLLLWAQEGRYQREGRAVWLIGWLAGWLLRARLLGWLVGWLATLVGWLVG